MFDTMTLTKIAGGFCGALLVFLLGNWAGGMIYSTGGGGHGEEHSAGYVIPVEDSGGGGEAEAEPAIGELYAEADPAKGESVFNKCKACHSVAEGENGTGPTLHGVVGRPVDSIDGFGYSGALEKVADTWTPENLYHFLKKPAAFAPGTAMGFAGLPKPEDRANLIAFLDQTDGDMTEVEAPAPEEDAEGGAEGDAAEGEKATEDGAAAGDDGAAPEGADAEENAAPDAAEDAAGEQPAGDEAREGDIAAEEQPAAEDDGAAAEEAAPEGTDAGENAAPDAADDSSADAPAGGGAEPSPAADETGAEGDAGAPEGADEATGETQAE